MAHHSETCGANQRTTIPTQLLLINIIGIDINTSSSSVFLLFGPFFVITVFMLIVKQRIGVFFFTVGSLGPSKIIFLCTDIVLILVIIVLKPVNWFTRIIQHPSMHTLTARLSSIKLNWRVVNRKKRSVARVYFRVVKGGNQVFLPLIQRNGRFHERDGFVNSSVNLVTVNIVLIVTFTVLNNCCQFLFALHLRSQRVGACESSKIIFC